jgi:hypothetical protein
MKIKKIKRKKKGNINCFYLKDMRLRKIYEFLGRKKNMTKA